MKKMLVEHELNLHHLELFHAVVEEGAVGRAAARLGTSQPSVSRQVQDLEERLGLRLLERLPRGVRPTEAGAELFRHARDIFAHRDLARRAMRDRLEISAGIVALGAGGTVGTYILPDLVSRFRRRHPGPDLRISTGTVSEVEDLLRSGGIEFGLVEGGASKEFLRGTFGREEMVAVASPGTFAGGRIPRTPEAFCAHPMVLRETGAGTRQVVDRLLAARGIRPAIVAVLDNAEAIRRFVEAGVGVSFLPRIAVAESIARGRLVEVPLRESPMELRFEWIRVPGRPLSPASERFLREIAGPARTGRRSTGPG